MYETDWLLNPFAPQLPVTTREDHKSLLQLVMSSVLMFKNFVLTILSANLRRVKRSFKLYQSEHDSVKEARVKGKKKKTHITH